MTSTDRLASARDQLTEPDYNAENLASSSSRFITGLIFFAGSTASFATASSSGCVQEAELEKTSCEKTEGVTGCRKDRRVAETKREEESPGIDEIIARPALTAGYRRQK